MKYISWKIDKCQWYQFEYFCHQTDLTRCSFWWREASRHKGRTVSAVSRLQCREAHHGIATRCQSERLVSRLKGEKIAWMPLVVWSFFLFFRPSVGHLTDLRPGEETVDRLFLLFLKLIQRHKGMDRAFWILSILSSDGSSSPPSYTLLLRSSYSSLINRPVSITIFIDFVLSFSWGDLGPGPIIEDISKCTM